MSYEEALQAAGAEVMEFEQFGSYQGDWWAKVRYKGELGWAQGSYGSCSGCDAFAAEFGLAEGDCVEHAYNHKDDCLECQEVKKKYAEKLADFGRGYLGGLLTQEKAEEEAARNLDWDSEAQAMLDWLRTHSLAANVQGDRRCAASSRSVQRAKRTGSTVGLEVIGSACENDGRSLPAHVEIELLERQTSHDCSVRD